MIIKYTNMNNSSENDILSSNSVQSMLPSAFESSNPNELKMILDIHERLQFCNNNEFEKIKNEIAYSDIFSMSVKSVILNDLNSDDFSSSKNNILKNTSNTTRRIKDDLCEMFGLKSISISCGDDHSQINKCIFDIRSGFSAFCHVAGINPSKMGLNKLRVFINTDKNNTMKSFVNVRNNSIEIFGNIGDVSEKIFEFMISSIDDDIVDDLVKKWVNSSRPNIATSVLRKNYALSHSSYIFKSILSSVDDHDDDLSSKLFKRYRLFQKWRDDFAKGSSQEQLKSSWSKWRTGNRVAFSSVSKKYEHYISEWHKEEFLINDMFFKNVSWLNQSWVRRLCKDDISIDMMSKSLKIKLLSIVCSEFLRSELGRDTWLCSYNKKAPQGEELKELVFIWNTVKSNIRNN